MAVKYLGQAMDSGLFAKTARGKVLRGLCNCINPEEDVAFPSYDYLAFISGVSRRSAIDEVQALERMQVIAVQTGGGKQKANRYCVNWPMLQGVMAVVDRAKKAGGNSGKLRIKAMEFARDTCEDLIAKGELAALYAFCNSAISVTKGAVSVTKGAVAAPNPLGSFKEQGARGRAKNNSGNEGGQEASEEVRRLRRRERKLLVDWLLTGWVYERDTFGLTTKRLRTDPDRAESEEYALSQSQQSINRVGSWAKWALRVVSGEDPNQPGTAEVGELVKRLKHEDMIANEYGRDSNTPVRQRMAALINAYVELRPAARQNAEQSRDGQQAENAA